MGSQAVEGLIRSLIRQFSTGVPVGLAELYRSCHDGGSQPSFESLQATLLHVLESFNNVYIVLDALDECAERKDLLKWIEAMTSWKKGKLHLLATSRPEEDIAMYMRSLDPHPIPLRAHVVTRDIEKYINNILQTEKAFGRWKKEDKSYIKKTLLENARGM
jgi:hypothetical protein